MQCFSIVYSSKDNAGVNIAHNLIENFNFKKIGKKFEENNILELNLEYKKIRLYETEQDLIFSENIDKKIEADILIFASKHRSKENTPSFAVHAIGNWGKAELGGQDGTLCPSSAIMTKNLFMKLCEHAKHTNYEITLEATHHGPFVEKPAVFIEIGSTEKEWNDRANGELIARTIMQGIKNENVNYKSCIILGGGHYNQTANKLMLRTDYAVGHICPKYALEYLNEEILKQAIDKTNPKPEIILIDWKGLGKEKQRIVGLLKKLNVEFKRADQVLLGSKP